MNARKKILLTGGTGYIGSHTAVELQQNGFDVVLLDNLSNSSYSVVKQIESITGIRPYFAEIDLRDKQSVTDFMHTHSDIEDVIHFAALKSIPESIQDPILYYENNISSLLNLLNVCKSRKLNFVFSSSCTVYGKPDRLPVDESAQVKVAESPYGNTKQIGEEILNDYTKSAKNCNVIVLRYFNPVGAHPSAKIGELPNGVPQNLVPFITQSAAGKRGDLTVFGNDYDTPDGTCIRDYIHVVDLANAHLAAIKRIQDKKLDSAFEVYNIGTGNGISVLELLTAFQKVNGVKLNWKKGGRREGDIAQIWGDVNKAKNILGWRAKYEVEDMMLSAWKWQKHIDKETPAR